jgi:hypothetical protein
LRAKFELLVGGDAGRLYQRLLSVEDVDDMATLFEGFA